MLLYREKFRHLRIYILFKKLCESLNKLYIKTTYFFKRISSFVCKGFQFKSFVVFLTKETRLNQNQSSLGYLPFPKIDCLHFPVSLCSNLYFQRCYIHIDDNNDHKLVHGRIFLFHNITMPYTLEYTAVNNRYMLVYSLCEFSEEVREKNIWKGCWLIILKIKIGVASKQLMSRLVTVYETNVCNTVI